MTSNIKPRGDYVLIRVVEQGKTKSGIHIPQQSVQGKQFFVEAFGPLIKDLAIGDRVQMVTYQGKGDFFPLPNDKDLLIIKQEYIALVYPKE